MSIPAAPQINIEAVTFDAEVTKNASALDPNLGAEFQRMIADPSMEIKPVKNVDESFMVPGITNSWAIEPLPTLGEKILDGLTKVKEKVDGNFEGLLEAVKAVDPNSVQSLVELQYEVIKFSVELDVISKISGQTTQHMDRFLNQQ